MEEIKPSGISKSHAPKRQGLVQSSFATVFGRSSDNRQRQAPDTIDKTDISAMPHLLARYTVHMLRLKDSAMYRLALRIVKDPENLASVNYAWRSFPLSMKHLSNDKNDAISQVIK